MDYPSIPLRPEIVSLSGYYAGQKEYLPVIGKPAEDLLLSSPDISPLYLGEAYDFQNDLHGPSFAGGGALTL